MNVPNTLSLFRIGLIPCYIGLFYMPGRWTNYAAAVVFAVAAMTDWLAEIAMSTA